MGLFNIFKKNKNTDTNQANNKFISDIFNENNSKDFNVIPLSSVNGIEFGISRNEVWNILGKPNMSYRKTQFEKVDTDDYTRFHIYYDDNYNFEYIEIFEDESQFERFGDFDIYYNNNKLPKKYSKRLEYFKTLYDDIEEDGNGFISKKGSVCVYIENDDDIIDAIGFGRKDFF